MVTLKQYLVLQLNTIIFTRLLFKQEVGLGESYTANEWESENVQDVLECFVHNLKAIEKSKPFLFKIVNIFLKISHFLNRNTKYKSKKNIHKHYDLSNNFFQTFLDKSMMYSCGVYPSKDASLEEAQKKMTQIIKKADIKPDHHKKKRTGWGLWL